MVYCIIFCIWISLKLILTNVFKILAGGQNDGKGKVYPIKGDVRNEEDVVSAFQWIEENLGPVHILVNNAGIVSGDSLTGK